MGEPPDQVLITGGIPEPDAADVLRFVKQRPGVSELGRSLTPEEVKDLGTISPGVGPQRYEVTTGVTDGPGRLLVIHVSGPPEARRIDGLSFSVLDGAW